jgi:hypothetical protein
MRISKSIFAALVLTVTATCVYAQEECKVLMENIQSSYDGECKNHLANGKGTARGLDTYTGSFKKGYPNGKGIYKWSTGEYYDGEWVMGKRHGIGEYHNIHEGHEVVQSGIWKDDRYLGPKPIAPVIRINQNVSDVKISKTGEGDEVILKIMMAGNVNTSVTDLSINVNSGNEFRYGSYMGYKSIVFPFICKVNYTTFNKLRTMQIPCVLEFEIIEPGRWEVKLENN